MISFPFVHRPAVNPDLDHLQPYPFEKLRHLFAGVVPASALVWTVSGGSLVFLALLGSLAARAGGAPLWRSVARVTFWGALAMALTAGIGALFGANL